MTEQESTWKEEENLPIKDFDNLTVQEIIGKLNSLSYQNLQTIKKHEKCNKNREDVLQLINFRMRIFRENGRL